MGTHVIPAAEIKQLRIGIYSNASLPAFPEGCLAYDVTNHKLMIRVSGAWETITST